MADAGMFMFIFSIVVIFTVYVLYKTKKTLIHWIMVHVINPLSGYSIWVKGKEPVVGGDKHGKKK